MDEGERMKRTLAMWAGLAALLGWGGSAAQAGKFMSQAFNNSPEGVVRTGPIQAYEIPGVVGPNGTPVLQRAASSYREPTGADYARAFIAQQYPPEILHEAKFQPPPPGLVPVHFTGQPQGAVQQVNYQPPASPTFNPIHAGIPGIAPPGPPGAVAALGALTGQPSSFGVHRTEIRFVGPAGMKISWFAPRQDGKAGFTPQYLEAPARYNFLQQAVYRLKLSDLPNRPGVDLYPTLEITPANAKTATFLAHSAVPISFTEEDFEQVTAGNFVVKVIYLPDPQYQDLAATGPDEVVSSRLEPGVDPVLEAKRRGSILAIVRLGNIDLEAPNTPAMDAPDPNALRHAQAMQQMQQQQMQAMAAMQQQMQQRGGQPGMMLPGLPMLPPGMMPPGMMPPARTPGLPPAPNTQGVPASTPSTMPISTQSTTGTPTSSTKP